MLFMTCIETQIIFGLYGKFTERMGKTAFSVADFHSCNSGICNPAKSKFTCIMVLCADWRVCDQAQDLILLKFDFCYKLALQ